MAIFFELKSVDSLRTVILNEVNEFGFQDRRCFLHLLARQTLVLGQVPGFVEVGGRGWGVSGSGLVLGGG